MKNLTFVLATKNKGKVRELERLFREALGKDIVILSLDEVGLSADVEETGTTFAENALIKAEAAAKSGYISLADDSGLCVTALDMAPGVYSARYAGVHGDDAANNALLLKNLEGEENREAAFVCSLACAFPDGTPPLVAEGRVTGEILKAPQGEGGFGYDPLFYYPPFRKSFAELSGEEKNRISHRGAAVLALCKMLKARGL